MAETAEAFDAETVRADAAAADAAEGQVGDAVMKQRVVERDAAGEGAVEHELAEFGAARKHVQAKRFRLRTNPRASFGSIVVGGYRQHWPEQLFAHGANVVRWVNQQMQRDAARAG